jgi:hypothetical protein
MSFEQKKLSRRTLLKGAAAVAGGAVLLKKSATAASLPASGASTTVRPYAIPSTGGVEIIPILTVGEAAENGYRMVGIPDGLGAFREAQTISLFMHHELGASVGTVRAHGSKGAFVSKWTIDRKTLKVVKGEDFMSSPSKLNLWNTAAKTYATGTRAFDRLCSADMADEKAFRHGNLGTKERLFLGGEETNGGSALAHITTGPNAGQSWELPRLGKLAWENAVACPHGKEKTIVACMDDGQLANDTVTPVAANNPSEVFIYVGTKQAQGNEIERAGLTNGKLYGVKVFRNDGTLVEAESDTLGIGSGTAAYVGSGRFELVEIGTNGDVSGMTGVQQEQSAIDKKVFRMQRPEDAAWDPRGEGKDALYFVTTASINPLRNSRLWRLKFDDVDNPERGGMIEILLTNTPGRMFDNICMDKNGRLMIQEDTGNNPWVAKIWAYNVDTKTLVEVARHDPALFENTASPMFITQDEESSGIIDAQHIFGDGWFLFVVQNHKAIPAAADPELVEGGQLLAMFVDPEIASA